MYPIRYYGINMMFEVRTTIEFDNWLGSLKDRRDIFRISARIDRIEQGNLGDTKPIKGEDFSEFRFFFGAGYRIYYTKKGETIILLLVGGNKDTQQKDIEKARLVMNSLDLKENQQ